MLLFKMETETWRHYSQATGDRRQATEDDSPRGAAGLIPVDGRRSGVSAWPPSSPAADFPMQPFQRFHPLRPLDALQSSFPSSSEPPLVNSHSCPKHTVATTRYLTTSSLLIVYLGIPLTCYCFQPLSCHFHSLPILSLTAPSPTLSPSACPPWPRLSTVR
jgi:hypothetical protein